MKIALFAVVLARVSAQGIFPWTNPITDWSKDMFDDLLTSVDEFADKTKDFTKDQWTNLVDNMPSVDLAELSADFLKSMPQADVDKLKDMIKGFKVDDVKAWAAEEWAKVPIDNINLMDWKPLQSVPASVVAKWTAADWKTMSVEDIVKFTGTQFSAVSADAIKDMSGDFWASIPSFQLKAMTPEQIAAIKDDFLGKLGDVDVAFLKPEQWAAIDLESLTGLSKAKIQAIDPSVVASWTKEQLDVINWDEIKKLGDDAVKNLNLDHLASWTEEKIKDFPASVSLNFGADQLTAWSDKLTKMGAEELAKFDLEALKASVWADLGDDTQALLEKLKEQSKVTEDKLKTLLTDLDLATKKFLAATEKKQNTEADPAATEEDKAAASAEYETAKAEQTSAQAEVVTVRNDMDGVVPQESSAHAAQLSALTVVLAAMALSA
jgi:predicted transcriptional regulator